MTYKKLRVLRSAGLFETLEPRQLFAAAPGHTPFKTAPMAIPGFIHAENFDKGAAGVVYNDTTTGNSGGAYRQTNVDLKTIPGFNTALTNTRPGEWLDYTVNIQTGGRYIAEFRIASAIAGAKFHLDVDGVNKTGPLTVINTGGAATYKIIKQDINLSAGVFNMRLQFDSTPGANQNVVDLDYMKFSGPFGPTVPPTPAVNLQTRWPTTWTRKADAPIDRFESHGFTYQNKLYVVGGWANDSYNPTKRVDVYDPATNVWTRLGDSPAPETHNGVAIDEANGIAYFIYGHRGPNPPVPTKEFWKYTFATDTWDRLPDMPNVGGAGTAQVVGRKLHYFGGVEEDRVTNTGEHLVLDLDGPVEPITNEDGSITPARQWQQAAPLPLARDHLSSVVIDGKIYALGGEFGHDRDHIQQSALHVYDPLNDTWTQLANMPIQKSHFESSTFVLNGQIYAVGGQIAPQSATNQVSQYDPVLNRWAVVGTIPAIRQGTVALVIGDFVIFTGGGSQNTREQHRETWIGKLLTNPVNVPAK